MMSEWLYVLPHGTNRTFMFCVDLDRMIAGKLITRYSNVKIRESIQKGESDYVVRINNYTVDDKRRFTLTSTKYKLREISVRRFKELVLQIFPSFYLQTSRKPISVFYKLREELYLVHHYYVVTSKRIYVGGYEPSSVKVERFVVIPPLMLMFTSSSFSTNDSSEKQRNDDKEKFLQTTGAFVLPCYYKHNGKRGKRIISLMYHDHEGYLKIFLSVCFRQVS